MTILIMQCAYNAGSKIKVATHSLCLCKECGKYWVRTSQSLASVKPFEGVNPCECVLETIWISALTQHAKIEREGISYIAAPTPVHIPRDLI